MCRGRRTHSCKGAGSRRGGLRRASESAPEPRALCHHIPPARRLPRIAAAANLYTYIYILLHLHLLPRTQGARVSPSPRPLPGRHREVKCQPRLHVQGRPEPRRVRVQRKYGFPRGVAARASCKERESRRRHSHCWGGISGRQVPVPPTRAGSARASSGSSSSKVRLPSWVAARASCKERESHRRHGHGRHRDVKCRPRLHVQGRPEPVGFEFIESTASIVGLPPAPRIRSASLTVAAASHGRGGIGMSSAGLAYTCRVGPSLVGFVFIESTASLVGLQIGRASCRERV